MKRETVPHRAGQVLQDVFILADLQWQLFKSDAAECALRMLAPAIALAVGLVLVLSAVPLALTAIALFLVWLGMPAAGAFALVAVLSLAVAGGLAAWAWVRVRTVLDAFQHSREELSKNIAWLKEVLERSGRMVREPQDAARP